MIDMLVGYSDRCYFSYSYQNIGILSEVPTSSYEDLKVPGMLTSPLVMNSA
jgi:hypothetical protein